MDKVVNVKGKILFKSEYEFEWKVPDFFSLADKVSYCFESPQFSCLHETWRLHCYPNGKCPRSIFLSLKRVRSVSKRTLVCRWGIKQASGLEYISRTLEMTFKKDGDLKGDTLFLDRDYLCLHKDTVAPEGELTFFSVFGANSSEKEATQTTHPEGTDKVAQSFKNIFLSGEHHDMIVKVKDQDFRTHKLVLVVRSEVFASMFRHDRNERKTNVITIEDCEPEPFREFLSFLYSGKLENISAENMIDLYNIADKYQVDEAKSECVKYMMKNTTVDNFCDIITLALTHGEKNLQDSATEYFAKNAKKIIVSDKWLSFQKEYPIESNELNFKALMYLDPK